VPDSYGSLLAPLIIGRDNSFLAYGSNGFLTYDFNGELQSRVKLKEFRGSNFTWKSMGFGMEKLGNNFLYIDQGSRDIDYTNINLYKELRLLNWLDPESGEKEPFIQFPEASIFRNGKYFFRDSWAPAFTVVDDLIYVAFGIEPVVYLYETTPPYALVSSVPLDLPGFENYKETDDYVISLDLFYTSGRIENIKKIEGYIVVAYFPGYSVSDRQESFANKSLEEARMFRKRMHEKYTSQIAILDSMGHSLNDFVPEGLIASSMLVRNGELWMQEKPDEEVERDYFRLFRVGLRDDGIKINNN
jgi:hypothetical protein